MDEWRRLPSPTLRHSFIPFLGEQANFAFDE